MIDTKIKTGKVLDVLLVDNVEINLMVLQHLLEQLGHRVKCVSSVDETVDMLNGSRVDLVLLNHQLLGGDGLKLLGAMKQKMPELGILLLSGSEGELTEEQKSVGISARLTMPVTESAFATALNKVFNAKEGAPSDNLGDVLDIKMLTDYMQLVGAQSLLKGADMMADLMPGYLQELEQARQAGDDKSTGSHAHKIKGAAGSLGLQRLQKAAARAQHVDEEGWANGIDGWIQNLKKHFPNDLEVLRSWLSSHQS